MYVLAGVIAAAAAAYLSPQVRARAQSAGVFAVWYGARAYTELSVYGAAAAAYVYDICGLEPRDPGAAAVDVVNVEMVGVGDKDVEVYVRRKKSRGERTRVIIGRSREEVEQDREPCSWGVYGATVRLRDTNGEARSFPVEFGEDNYCLVGNVLFDPVFVAHWLRAEHGMLIEESDRWTTSFIGPDMLPVTVSHTQECVCEEDTVTVRDVQISREEPAGGCAGRGEREPAREPWLLDLSGNLSPGAETI